MDALRKKFDGFYDYIKPAVFGATARNPEIAHSLFVNSLKSMRAFGLSKLILNNSANNLDPGYTIANGAGFNKNGEIDPRLMKLLGFDRVVIGTVTGDSWNGNPKPRIKRFPNTGSMVNWMGLPGIGAKSVAKKLEKYGDHGVPLTINLMATPGKSGQDVIKDISKTTRTMRDLAYVDTLELNISCPNTHGGDGCIDARKENSKNMGNMMYAVRNNMYSHQSLVVKLSPDLTEHDADDVVRAGEENGVDGYTTANTTTVHNLLYIPQEMGKGGASGNAVWDASVRTQKYLADRTDKKLYACGGINSAERAKYRTSIGNCTDVQVFTGLIFEGTGLLGKLREE